MFRSRTLCVVILMSLAVVGTASARGGGGGGSASIHSGVTYHPSQGWTVASPTTNVRDHRNGNNPGGGVTITTGTPTNVNLHHGGMKDPPSRWRGEGTVRDHRSSSAGLR